MTTQQQIEDAHRQYRNEHQYKQRGNRPTPTIEVKQIWQHGGKQMTVYTTSDVTEIPDAEYQQAWHSDHPGALNVAQ